MIFFGRFAFDSLSWLIAFLISSPMSVRIRVWAWIDWFCLITSAKDFGLLVCSFQFGIEVVFPNL